jgi:hypothetical protein
MLTMLLLPCAGPIIKPPTRRRNAAPIDAHAVAFPRPINERARVARSRQGGGQRKQAIRILTPCLDGTYTECDFVD